MIWGNNIAGRVIPCSPSCRPPTWPAGSSQRPPPPGSLPDSLLSGVESGTPLGLPYPGSVTPAVQAVSAAPPPGAGTGNAVCAHHTHHFRGLGPSEKPGHELPAALHRWRAPSTHLAPRALFPITPSGPRAGPAHTRCSVSTCDTKELRVTSARGRGITLSFYLISHPRPHKPAPWDCFVFFVSLLCRPESGDIFWDICSV